MCMEVALRIISAKESKCFFVETDEDEYCQYTRYSSESWFVAMGESDEPVYDCSELERLFQEHQAKNRLVSK